MHQRQHHCLHLQSIWHYYLTMNEASILGIDEGDAIVSCLLIFGLW